MLTQDVDRPVAVEVRERGGLRQRGKVLAEDRGAVIHVQSPTIPEIGVEVAIALHVDQCNPLARWDR